MCWVTASSRPQITRDSNLNTSHKLTYPPNFLIQNIPLDIKDFLLELLAVLLGVGRGSPPFRGAAGGPRPRMDWVGVVETHIPGEATRHHTHLNHITAGFNHHSQIISTITLMIFCTITRSVWGNWGAGAGITGLREEFLLLLTLARSGITAFSPCLDWREMDRQRVIRDKEYKDRERGNINRVYSVDSQHNEAVITASYSRHGLKAVIPDLARVKSKRNSSLYSSSFGSVGPRLWNSLPKDLREIADQAEFKANLDCFLREVPDLPPTPGYSSQNRNSLSEWCCGSGMTNVAVLGRMAL
eukprot:sb/3467350/